MVGCLFEAQGVEGAAQLQAKSFHRQLMIVAVRQTGDSNRTDDARAQYAKRKAAAMAGIIGERQPIAIEEAGFFLSISRRMA